MAQITDDPKLQSMISEMFFEQHFLDTTVRILAGNRTPGHALFSDVIIHQLLVRTSCITCVKYGCGRFACAQLSACQRPLRQHISDPHCYSNYIRRSWRDTAGNGIFALL